MRITTLLNYATDPLAAAEQARELEAAGVDCIWIPEAYGFDGVSLLGFLAASTDTGLPRCALLDAPHQDEGDHLNMSHRVAP